LDVRENIASRGGTMRHVGGIAFRASHARPARRSPGRTGDEVIRVHGTAKINDAEHDKKYDRKDGSELV
jgi:hypothetical protein